MAGKPSLQQNLFSCGCGLGSCGCLLMAAGFTILIFLGLCLSVAAAEPVSDSEITKAVAAAAKHEYEQLKAEIEAQLLGPPGRIKTYNRSGQAIFSTYHTGRKAAIARRIKKKQMKAAKRRLENLQSGKVRPEPTLDPFNFKIDQIGRLPVSDAYYIIDTRDNAVQVRCKHSWNELRGGGGGTFSAAAARGMIASVPREKFSLPFWIEDMTGRTEQTIKAPKIIYYVRRSDDTFRLIPIATVREWVKKRPQHGVK